MKQANTHLGSPQIRYVCVVMEGLVRFSRSCMVGALIALDYNYHTWGLEDGSPESDLAYKLCHRRSAERLVELALKNGGLYVKSGQGFASMNHILPKEYCETMAILQDQASSSPLEDVRQVFREEFDGKDVTDLFSFFEEEPCAAASMAQVHRATTKEGRRVAVKVQYLDMVDRFEGDMFTMELLMNIAAWMYPGFDFGWLMRKMHKELAAELDFEQEARNAETCLEEVKHLGNIYVPEVISSLSTKRVMTTEFIDGCKVTDIEALDRMGVDKREMMDGIVRVFSHQIFCTGFVHADPHPGNILIRKVKGRTQIVLIDHGLYTHIPNQFRVSLCEFWRASVLRDEVAMEKHADSMRVDGFRLLATILFQRPYTNGKVGFKSKVTPEDIALMQKQSAEHMDVIVDILKQMPYFMSLVLRNINLVRSINSDLGSPSNRLSIMGRGAVEGRRQWNHSEVIVSDITTIESASSPHGRSGLASAMPRAGLLDRLIMSWEVLIYEYCLRRDEFARSCTRYYFRFLQFIGLAPADLGEVLEDYISSA